MKGNKTKENLIEVAIPMMAENGVFGVSLRDIAKKAEINVSSVLYHFGSKEEFIITCGEYCVQELTKTIKSITEAQYGSTESLKQMIQSEIEKHRNEIVISVMLLMIETSGFRKVYESYVSDFHLKMAGLDNTYILNLRSFISMALFKNIDLRVANEKLEGQAMFDLLCLSTEPTL